jgi:O-6-methylguanine DNA methyltransferase
MIGAYQSPLGQIIFIMNHGYLTEMMFDDQKINPDSDPMIDSICQQLDKYFKHELTNFSIPLKWYRGTPFQIKVWQAMQLIPFGETKSYSEIAKAINHPKAVRAVGQACKRNPIGIVVPCHRVIGKDGSMTGYSGKAYIGLKKQLLDHETSMKEHIHHA